MQEANRMSTRPATFMWYNLGFLLSSHVEETANVISAAALLWEELSQEPDSIIVKEIQISLPLCRLSKFLMDLFF